MVNAAKNTRTRATDNCRVTNLLILGKRDTADRDLLMNLLELERNMPAEKRDRIAAMLFLDYRKMTKEQQDRFVQLMSAGTPEERRRIGCLIESMK